MKKAEYQKYLQSAHWQSRRREAIEATGHKCEKCEIPRWLAQIAYAQDLNVHHLSYESLGCEDSNDLEILCRRCHDIETFGRSDFRSPKTAKCVVCEENHWNVYSNLCEACAPLWGMCGMRPLDLFAHLGVTFLKITKLQRSADDDDIPF